MELENILSQLKGIGSSGMSKQASEEKPAQNKEAQAQKELIGALTNALNKPSSEKTASESTSASAELMKMATDLAGAEQEALVKQAHLYGAAVADGFVSRLGQFQNAAARVPATKTAQDNSVPTREEFDKFASENPELIKQAMELGYRDAQGQIAQMQMSKLAQENPEAAEKIAAFNQGYAQANAQLQKLASTPDGREKLAAFKQGYEDTQKETVKLAEDCAVRGYNDTLKVLQAVAQ
jgi:hypothetical protein